MFGNVITNANKKSSIEVENIKDITKLNYVFPDW